MGTSTAGARFTKKEVCLPLHSSVVYIVDQRTLLLLLCSSPVRYSCMMTRPFFISLSHSFLHNRTLTVRLSRGWLSLWRESYADFRPTKRVVHLKKKKKTLPTLFSSSATTFFCEYIIWVIGLVLLWTSG